MAVKGAGPLDKGAIGPWMAVVVFRTAVDDGGRFDAFCSLSTSPEGGCATSDGHGNAVIAPLIHNGARRLRSCTDESSFPAGVYFDSTKRPGTARDRVEPGTALGGRPDEDGREYL